MRNICSKVKVKERNEVMKDFKKVYQQDNAISAQNELLIFIDKWKRYPSIKKSLMENQYLFTFYRFPKSIWGTIYNTNIIESFNRLVKRMTSHKLQFPSEEALEKVIVSVAEEYNIKNIDKVHKGFGVIQAEYWE